jgi:RNA polymerase sigma factor (sigma-70 family)
MTTTDQPASATDAEHFAAFYARELGGQVRRAALLTGSAELANDLVHDAFVELYRRWGEIVEPGPYLNRAVLNRCRDAARRRVRQRRVLGRLARHGDVDPAEAPLADVLDVLPFHQRAVVVLRFYVGMGNAEIAQVLRCPPGSVGPWLERALAKLRKELA